MRPDCEPVSVDRGIDLSLRKSLAWMGWAQAISVAMQFASSVVLARYLTPYEAGIYGLALATVGVLSIVQSLGLQAILVREEQLTPEFTATAFAVNAAISILLALLIVGASFLGGSAFHENGVQRVMLVLAVMPLFGIFNFVPSAMLEREGNFRVLALIGTISGAASTIATISLAVAGFSYMSVAWAQWIGSIVNILLANWFAKQHVSYRIGFSAWRRVAEFGFQMAAVTGVIQLSQRVSEMCLGRTLGLNSLGLFNRAGNINAIVWNNIHMVIGRVLFVDFAQINRSGESLRPRYLRVVSVMTALLWPAFGGLAVIGKPLIYHVYGARWVGSYGALVFLTLASMGSVAITMTWEIFAATGNLRTQTRIEFIRAFVGFGAFVAGCFISLEAAAASRVFDVIFAFVLYRPHLNRMTHTSLRDFIPIYGKSLVVTILAITPSSILMLKNSLSPTVELIPLITSVISGGILWFVGLIFLNNSIFDEIKILSRFRYLNKVRYKS